MKKQITFRQYKAIDIALLSVLLMIFEALATYATIHWFSLQAVAISVVPLMMMLMMMRWGWFAAIGALVGGVAYCLAGGASAEQYLIYCVGNLFGVLSVLIINKLGNENVRTDWIKLSVVTVSTYLFMNIGRWLVSLIFAPTFKTILVFITTDIISLVVAIVGVMSLRKSDGMLEDQKSYLLRLDREAREEAERKANAPVYGYDDRDDEYDELLDDELGYDDSYDADDGCENENNDELI